ncbi:type II toxin-antitoxin system HicA family toxin (plasmid) [Halodesulfovibrio aestuarii]|uniref:type II toxin-antitoxin system HicA family toxin n=1 Tax=Halodesulfovibrio aestuarii TaxID=126333 RepID=UPI000933E042|nr:type II toxin-antitoxin system HicA family toxin [Halodesulfovibrio aestuarii]
MTNTEVIKKLKKAGFRKSRKGSKHDIYQHPDGRMVPVPRHKGKDLKIGTLRSIEKLANVTLS